MTVTAVPCVSNIERQKGERPQSGECELKRHKESKTTYFEFRQLQVVIGKFQVKHGSLVVRKLGIAMTTAIQRRQGYHRLRRGGEGY